MRPFGAVPKQASSPVFSYPYAEYMEALEEMRVLEEWDPCHGLKMTFINPQTGGPVMPTIAAFVQLLPKAFNTVPYRSTDGAVYTVVDGTGRAYVGDEEFQLTPNSIFVVPSWCSLRIEAVEDLVLFSFSDRSAQEKLCLWREQRGNDGDTL
tara:strand:- start:127 stop:582 length:456 start_codon:yes stop_codon:yes gene_type:complete